MRRTTRTLRWVGLALTVVSASTLTWSVLAMADRLASQERTEPLWYAHQIRGERFEYRGRPVRIGRLADQVGEFIEVRWGEQSARFPAGRSQSDQRLPEQVRQQEWLAVLEMASVRGDEQALERALAQGSAETRLVVVARRPAPGYDPETWGQAMYKDWVYEFVVLHADGSMTQHSRTYDELIDKPNSRDFVAGMHVTPTLNTPAMRSSSPIAYPNYEPVQDAFGAMGWTWPAAGFSTLGLIVGAMSLAGSFVSRRFGER